MNVLKRTLVSYQLRKKGLSDRTIKGLLRCADPKTKDPEDYTDLKLTTKKEKVIAFYYFMTGLGIGVILGVLIIGFSGGL